MNTSDRERRVLLYWIKQALRPNKAIFPLKLHSIDDWGPWPSCLPWLRPWQHLQQDSVMKQRSDWYQCTSYILQWYVLCIQWDMAVVQTVWSLDDKQIVTYSITEQTASSVNATSAVTHLAYTKFFIGGEWGRSHLGNQCGQLGPPKPRRPFESLITLLNITQYNMIK